MKIIITITRIKKHNELWEIFTTNAHKYCYDSKRQAYYAYWLLCNIYAIHPQLSLRDIKYLQNSTIYIYNYIDERQLATIPPQQTIIFTYEPVLGEKKCHKCFYIHNKICIYKSKKIQKYSWYKCLYWKEKSLHTIKDISNGTLFNNRRPKTNL